MDGNRITLGEVLGFRVSIHLSWLPLALLMATMTSATFRAEGYPPTMSWAMAALVTAGLFASIVAHELSHSVVGRRHGMNIRGITLFLLGGVAEMEAEPQAPWGEFVMAAVGPLASLVIAGGFFGGWALADHAGAPAGIVEVLSTLAGMNLVLALFNLLPAFPLDGGRILRSVLWGLTGNQLGATRVASWLGVAFGVLLAAGGLVKALAPPHEWLGLWYAVMGVFVIGAARLPYRQLLMRKALAGSDVRRYMDPNPVVVPRYIPLRELVETVLRPTGERIVPVVDGDRLLGVVTEAHVRAVPEDEWDNRSVGEMTVGVGEGGLVEADCDAAEAVARMGRTGASRLLVLDKGRLVGVLRLRDVMAALSPAT